MPDLLNVCSDFGTTLARPRDASRAVVLIGFKRQGNLGLGYLASTLRARGYRVDILDFEDPYEEIEAAVLSAQPVLVGFSLIFQFYIVRFERLMCRLRADGVNAHFTMGGHFPSLSYEHALELAPQLDSVVRFEGELTLLELVDCLTVGREWRSIQGIAYRQDERAVATQLRPLIHDLDEIPYPDRAIQPRVILGRPVMQMLASRGCARTCSFCSIHMFYRSAPGKVVRTRKPAEIAREMRMLHEERGISLFLFQDDDFPVFGPAWHRWTREFLAELYRQDLPSHILWKINARADAVDPDLFAEMRDAGMYLVYMGLESGSEEGLVTLNKSITVQQNIRAVDCLKELNILFDFGFMLLDPSSTFQSILENVAFLRRIVGDGYMAAEFCRMIPYDGTPIKEQLAQQGRLRGDVCNPDYDFLDPRLHDFYAAVSELLNITGWIHGLQALSPQLKNLWSEFAVIERLFPSVPDIQAYKSELRQITKASNEVLFQVVEDLAYAFIEDRRPNHSQYALREKCSRFVDGMLIARNEFVMRNRLYFLKELGIEEPQAVA
ncbi:cobalamin B12-binding domain-containing protein [Alloacidobacterium dinghuense]|uniref:Cobalamin B12-binding domain-containing protein n=1 Tax=Alloacidobacterium dinghuense TaxID=2763107 RepID=A0A7G8BNK3_9BACT|nr:radical SAM protein [Alloacidobacterium dinghuense]QNI34123.1 cobalamin B12-binding domain-containing protein [Alloacidobacterium dinghuense]